MSPDPSVLVVELDRAFVENVSLFSRIASLIDKATLNDAPRYKLKRLTFGYDVSIQSAIPGTISPFLNSDFVIERRAGAPIGQNRFFSQARLTTHEHIRLLEEIERAATQT
jgi:hypothetical protein